MLAGTSVQKSYCFYSFPLHSILTTKKREIEINKKNLCEYTYICVPLVNIVQVECNCIQEYHYKQCSLA